MTGLRIHASTCNSGPAPFFKFEGPLVCQGPQNHLVGCLCDRVWELAGTSVSGFDCTQRALVRFLDWEDHSPEDCGPFDQLRFFEGTCYAGNLPIATYIETTECWRRHSDGTQWPRMVLLSEDTAKASEQGSKGARA